MIEKHTKASGVGLERLCAQDWLQSSETPYGVEFFEACFADQAHFSRMFKDAIGITPAQYRALRVPKPQP
jgi:AraC-like DNA-binding protein